MRLWFSCVAATFLLGAWAPVPSAPGGDPAVPADLACAGRGGVLERVGRMQSLQCVIRYADAGRRCTSGDQCQGDCRVSDGFDAPASQPAAGVCQATSSQFGCYAVIENGRASPAICVD